MSNGIYSLVESLVGSAGVAGVPLAQMGYPQKPNIGPIEMLIGFALTMVIFGALGFLFRKVEK